MKKAIKILIYGNVTVSAIVLLFLLLDWSPTQNNIDDSHRLFAAILFIFLSTLSLILSASSLFVQKIKSGHWNTRKLKPLFFVGLSALFLTLTTSLTPDDFVSSRDEFELLAREVERKPLDWEEGYGFKEPRQVGSAEVLSVRHDHSGAVIVTDADSSAIWSIQGWIKAPTQTAPSIPGTEIRHLSENWYTFRSR